MERPDLDTLACVNAACQLFRQTGHGHLVVRKTYGRDELRLLRCRRCGEAFSERRGTALFTTKVSEDKASEVIEHLAEGRSVSSPARLTKVGKATVARLSRVAGRHAERCHDRHVSGVRPRAVECDEQWSFVKNSKSAVKRMHAKRPVTNGIIAPWRLTARCSSRWSGASGRMSTRWPWGKIPKSVCALAICQRFLPMPWPATHRRCWRSSVVATRPKGAGVVQ